LKKKGSPRLIDGIIFALNTLSVLALLFIVLTDFVRSHDGQYMTWIHVTGTGGDWTTNFGIEILPLITVTIVFFVTQIYLNYRLMQKNSHKTENGKN